MRHLLWGCRENERNGGWLRDETASVTIRDGGNLVVTMEMATMTLSDLCLILGVLFAFGTLVLKIVEVTRR
jgi:hypothetical protein